MSARRTSSLVRLGQRIGRGCEVREVPEVREVREVRSATGAAEMKICAQIQAASGLAGVAEIG